MIIADVIRLAAGLVLIVLGAAVLLRRNRPLSAVGFGAFALALGAAYAMSAMGIAHGGTFTLAVNVVILAGFGTMFLNFPTRLARGERPLLGVAFAAGVAGEVFDHVPPFLTAAASGDGEALALVAFWFVVSVGILAGIVLFPLRARKLAPTEVSAARSLAILSVGTALFRGFDAAVVPAAGRGEAPLAAAMGPALGFALPAVLWVAVAARGAHARLARNTVLAHAIVVIAALVLSRSSVGSPLLALAGALLLGFAILRGQVDGLDIKVRWGISRSTVAAVFIAAFFVASEAAQQFLGETTGSAYLGIAAAGALVFAIAPLQRAAERLAERAVPLHRHESHESSGGRHSRLFLRVARALLLDGPMTPQKEAHLAEIAHELGISYPDALRLRRIVEEEVASA